MPPVFFLLCGSRQVYFHSYWYCRYMTECTKKIIVPLVGGSVKKEREKGARKNPCPARIHTTPRK